MLTYEENERALKELFQDVKTVAGTFPPVYTCGDIIISYDRQGHIKVVASTKSEPALSGDAGWFKRWQELLVPLATAGETEQGLIDHWIRRWHGHRIRLAKATRARRQLRQV